MPETEPSELTPRPMRRLFAYMAPMRGRLAFAIGSSFGNKVLDLAPPILVAWLMDAILRKPAPWLAALIPDTMAQIVFLAVATIIIFGGESLFQWMYQYAFMNLAQDVQHKLRLDAYRHMQSREYQFFEEHRLGKTLSVLNDDVNQLERFLNNGLSELVQLVALILFAGAVLFGVNPWMALVGLIPVPLIVWSSLKFSRMMEPRYKGVRGAVGEVVSRLENNIAGILVVKSFTAEEFEYRRVEQASLAYRDANARAIRLSAVFVPIIRMAIALSFAAVIVLGGYWAVEGRVSPGDVVLFAMMIQRLLWPLTRLGETLDNYQRARVSAGRVFNILDTPAKVQEPPTPKEIGRARGALEFSHVGFGYGQGLTVFKDLTFAIKPGEMIGVAGPTGAGKSTLIKLILRLYDVTGGAVKLDGVDLRELRQNDLRRQIALVSQDVYLFHGTIGENISYGMQSADRGSQTANSDSRIIDAARQAEFHDFVMTLPQGYETIVGERGIKLSGGQRQRLSLARAILKDAPILVLDEATSSVDTETERAIQVNLSKFTRGKTAIVIAHRLSTIRHAHRIVVLKDGGVHEEGAHDDLVARGGVYAELWNVQSGNVDETVASSR
ncbi:MAG: ABC transporter ATP-binding protein [Planctomycetes bacterium]|nr:ABC transporter ATP-binding protein [Planctomycetota bacterium]